MEPFKPRKIYSISFPNVKKCYVGCTSNLRIRKRMHLNKSANLNLRNLLMSEHGEDYFFKHYEKEYTVRSDAKKAEQALMDKFSNEGWELLNYVNAGNFGCSESEWSSVEAIKKEASKYKKKADFQKKCPGAYKQAVLRGILNDVCEGMTQRRDWDFDKVMEVAIKYKHLSDFSKNDCAAMTAARRGGYIAEVTAHMTKKQVHNKKWFPDTIKEEALKYKYRVDFSRSTSKAYINACKLGILDEVCAHMKKNPYKIAKRVS